jgi:excinuclease ABC subunit B
MDIDSMTPMEVKRLVKNLTTEMRLAAQDLNFELAAEIRDKIKDIN